MKTIRHQILIVCAILLFPMTFVCAGTTQVSNSINIQVDTGHNSGGISTEGAGTASVDQTSVINGTVYGDTHDTFTGPTSIDRTVSTTSDRASVTTHYTVDIQGSASTSTARSVDDQKKAVVYTTLEPAGESHLDTKTTASTTATTENLTSITNTTGDVSPQEDTGIHEQATVGRYVVQTIQTLFARITKYFHDLFA